MESASIRVRRSDQVTLAGERHGRRGAPAVVLLHAGVVDRRAWGGVIEALARDDLDLIAYDRRGYGETPAGDEAFTHLADLVAVLDDAGLERATVVGNSMGGALALDLAATAPERVTGLVLLAPGVTGMTDEGEEVQWEAGAEAEAILGALDQAQQAGDVDAAVRLQLHLWLDGPTQPEGRVVGPARELAAEMSRRILEATGGRDEGDAEPDTWHHLGSVDVPAIVAWGDLDIPGDFFWYEQIGRRLARATTRVLHGCAHLPSLEQPEVVAALVREAVGGRG